MTLLSIPFQGASPALEGGELPTSGVLTSFNFPELYPVNIDQVQKIQVPEGNTVWIRFTDFDCERGCDTVTITDKDGTRLGFFDGGENSDDDWQEEIVSNKAVIVSQDKDRNTLEIEIQDLLSRLDDKD